VRSHDIEDFTYTWYDPKGPIGPQEFADMAVELFLQGFARRRHETCDWNEERYAKRAVRISRAARMHGEEVTLPTSAS